MNDIIARRQNECRRRRLLFFDQAKHARSVGLGRIDPPDQTAADWRRVAAITGGNRERHVPGRRVPALSVRSKEPLAAIGTIVAPGEPVPGVSGMGAIICGEIRSRDWALACTRSNDIENRRDHARAAAPNPP